MSLRNDGEPPEGQLTQNPCHFCNGFYAKRSYGSPLCRVCHSFLYPLAHCKENVHQNRVVDKKSDSEDSGTEEPRDFYDLVSPALAERPSKRRFNGAESEELNKILHACSHARPKDVPAEGVVEGLPEDVLLVIFSYLDDISVWISSRVCTRWKSILDRQISETSWRNFTLQRWPLLNLQKQPNSWKQLYTRLIHSSNCWLCLLQHSKRLVQAKTHDIHHERVRSSNSKQSDISVICRDARIKHEILIDGPLEGAFLKTVENSVFGEWYATISGPLGSPYEGGQFFLSVSVPCKYPMHPPIVRFLTKIFHPNVSRHGDIGLDLLTQNWSLALTLSKVILSIQSLLTDPYTKVCMEPDIGELYRENFPLYEHTARTWTQLYAKNHLYESNALEIT